MAYDEEFYELYRQYLEEPIVRQNHDRMFRLFAQLIHRGRAKGHHYFRRPTVVDLGCGTGEYEHYDREHARYAGVDVNDTGSGPNFIPTSDYRSFDWLENLAFEPNAFISLFSIEPNAALSAEDKYEFYEEVFKRLPSIKFAMVSGFFYRSQKDLPIVGETGGIQSAQTIEDPSDFISEVFTEFRAHIETPSKMFGPEPHEIVEVWKFFMRK